jgi:hypothetical protein
MERFLGDWPSLSGGRGRANDYASGGWDNDDTSGYEKRFKAYCGIADWRRHYLCHFEVIEREGRYLVTLSPGGHGLFECPSPVSEKEAFPAVQSLMTSLSGRENYHIVHRLDEERYYLETSFYGQLVARSVMGWADEAGARMAADGIWRMWQRSPLEGDIRVSAYQFRSQLVDDRGQVVRSGVAGFLTEAQAWEAGKSRLGEINDGRVWVQDQDREIGRLVESRDPELANDCIDEKGFKIYASQDVVGEGKSDRWSFELLDDDNSFRLRSIPDYATEAEARTACRRLLFYLADLQYYRPRKTRGDWYQIVIRTGDETLAESEPEWETEMIARERMALIRLQVRQNLYRLRVVSRPFHWKFHFYLGLPTWGAYLFESRETYPSYEEALLAARKFHDAGPRWRAREEGHQHLLEAELSGREGIVCCLSEVLQTPMPDEPAAGAIRHLLSAKEDMYRIESGDRELVRRQISPDESSKDGNFIYRLVDKDHPRAFHPRGMDKQAAEEMVEGLIRKGRHGYSYLEICLGGDNTWQAKAGSAQPGKFYYVLRSRNHYFQHAGIPDGEHGLVLFESVKGYDSETDAQQAFQETYLDILEKARDHQNYGDGKYISLRDREEQERDRYAPKPVVFVPARTQRAFQDAAIGVVEGLVKAAETYPIRETRKKPDERSAGRNSGKEVTMYRWVIIEDGHRDWESARDDYATTAEAHADFEYARMLLNFAGNYFVDHDWKECRYRPGLREVLAESTHTYPDEDSAWGRKGVERFICTAQVHGGWHLDRRPDCTYSFFAACPDRRAVHPCEYESAAQRDQALQQLMREAGHFFPGGWVSGYILPEEPGRPAERLSGEELRHEHHFDLLDGRGHPLARVPLPPDRTEDGVLNRILDIEDALWAGQRPERFGNEMQLTIGKGSHAFAIAPAGDWTEEGWMQHLLTFAAYFPVIRLAGADGFEYRMEMKLPGFVDPPGRPSEARDCGCPPADSGHGPACYLAWQSEKGFGEAKEAWQAWLSILPALAVAENYRPIFREEIGRYGIELLDKGAVLARNPQSYSYPAMAVDALRRAGEKINSEGLDVVEHILLRPAASGHEIPECGGSVPCSTVWQDLPKKDALGNTVPPFTPGGDPYSFIMTVVLPAWPARFRKSENRVLLESILQREAPAHILTRILWLTPRDMCRFEDFYVGWIDSLRRQAHRHEPCGQFKTGDFIHFLFSVSPWCFPDCDGCDDRAGRAVVGEDPSLKQSRKWLSQINRLYCWKSCVGQPERPGIRESPERDQELPAWPADQEARELPTARLQPAWPIDLDAPREQSGASEEPERHEPGEEPERHESSEDPERHRVREAPERSRRSTRKSEEKGEEQGPADDKTVRKMQMVRNKKYEQRIDDWAAGAGDKERAGKARAFLLDPHPKPEWFEKNLKDSLRAPGKRKERDEQGQLLAEIVLSIYLDRLIMDVAEAGEWEQLLATMRKLNVRIGDTEKFYREWEPEAMWKMVRGLDQDKIIAVINKINETEQ